MTEVHWRFASAVYQSLLPCAGDAMLALLLSDGLSGTDGLPGDGDGCDAGEVTGLVAGEVAALVAGEVAGLVPGPIEETHGMVSGRWLRPGWLNPVAGELPDLDG